MRLLLVVGAVVLVGLLSMAGPAAQPRADFVFINRGDVTTLDLSLVSFMQDQRVARLLYEGLTRQDVFSKAHAPVPGVALRWDVSDDQRVYTFHLRDDARWSNGDSLTAGHFVWSWRRSMLPDYAGDYSSKLYLIRGAEAFARWRTRRLAEFAARTDVTGDVRRDAAMALWRETLEAFDQMVGVRAVDDRTLVVELERPTPYFIDLTSFPIYFPMYEPLVSAYERVDPQTARLRSRPDWTKPPALITNGPFRLVTWDFKREMRLEANTHWHGKDRLAISSIAMPTIEEPNAQVLAFVTGAVDYVTDVLPAYRGDMIAAKSAFYDEHKDLVASLRRDGLDSVEIDRRLPPDPRAHIHAMPAFGTYFYNFNCRPTLGDGRPNPFADARVRRAFALAVDREAISTGVRRIGEPAAATLIPPGSIAGYASPAGLRTDPDAARALLAQAGFPQGRGLPTIEILFSPDGGHDLIAQSIARDWTRELGVDVALRTRETKVFREDLKSGRYMVCRSGWFGDYGDPTTFLDINRTGEGHNDRGYANPAYDALLDAAQNETDASARLAILSRAEALIVEEELPLFPIFHYAQIYLFDAHKVSGITPHPRQVQYLDLVDILGDGHGPDVPKTMRP